MVGEVEVLFEADGWSQTVGTRLSHAEAQSAVVVAYLAGGAVGVGGGIPDRARVVQTQHVRGTVWTRTTTLARVGANPALDASWQETP